MAAGEMGAKGAAPVAEGPSPRARLSRVVGMTFVRREAWDWLLGATRAGAPEEAESEPSDRSEHAAAVLSVLDRRGASFFTELVTGSRLAAGEVEDALWELLTRGEVTADAVENLRVLQSPRRRREQKALRRGGPGRWSRVQSGEALSTEELHEKLARMFLHRYGVVWRDVVVREPLAPSWRELLPFYRTAEARGEIRGGRFIEPFGGEQFALIEAVEELRRLRRQSDANEWVVLAAGDPANLVGLADDAPRAPVPNRRLVFRNGAAVAAKAGGNAIEWLTEVDADDQRHVTALLADTSGSPARLERAWSR